MKPDGDIGAASRGSLLVGSDSTGRCKKSRHLRAESVGAASVAAKGESRPTTDRSWERRAAVAPEPGRPGERRK
jgi:hypothetical protein